MRVIEARIEVLSLSRHGDDVSPTGVGVSLRSPRAVLHHDRARGLFAFEEWFSALNLLVNDGFPLATHFFVWRRWDEVLGLIRKCHS